MKQSKFLTKVNIVNLPKLKGDRTQYYRVLDPIEYYSESMDTIYTIPSGFITDFASVPWYMQWLFKPDGEYKYEACLHDYLYVNSSIAITRRQADKVFLEAMKAGIVAEWKEWCLYKAVYYFGGKYFKKRS